MSSLSGLNVFDVVLTLDTSPYADGDVLADTQNIDGVFASAPVVFLKTVTVLDESDQGVPFDLIFLDANNSLGTENSAPNISDANARSILGRQPVNTGDYYDIGGARIATIDAGGLVLKAAADVTTLYVGAISRGAGTYAATGIRVKLGFAY